MKKVFSGDYGYKAMVLFFLLATTSLFAQTTPTLFNGYGSTLSAVNDGGVGSNVTINFTGGRNGGHTAFYTPSDAPANCALWVKCRRFQVLSIVSTSPFVVNVYDPNHYFTANNSLIKARYAILTEALFTAAPIGGITNVADGNAGTFAGMAPEEMACIQNYYAINLVNKFPTAFIYRYNYSGPPIGISGNSIDAKYAINSFGQSYIWNINASAWEPIEKDADPLNENQRLTLNGYKLKLIGNTVNDSIDLSGLLQPQFRGVWDASGGTLPAAGSGSGIGGAIMKGDYWIISTGGTLPAGILPSNVVVAGNQLYAIVNTPGTTAANWRTVPIASANYTFGNGLNNTGGLVKLNLQDGQGIKKDTAGVHIGGKTTGTAAVFTENRYINTPDNIGINFNQSNTSPNNTIPLKLYNRNTGSITGISMQYGLSQSTGYRNILSHPSGLILESNLKNIFSTGYSYLHNAYLAHPRSVLYQNLTDFTFALKSALNDSVTYKIGQGDITFSPYKASRPSDGALSSFSGFDANGKVTRHSIAEAVTALGVISGGGTTYTSSEGIKRVGSDFRLGHHQIDTPSIISDNRYLRTQNYGLHFNRLYAGDSYPINLYSATISGTSYNTGLRFRDTDGNGNILNTHSIESTSASLYINSTQRITSLINGGGQSGAYSYFGNSFSFQISETSPTVRNGVFSYDLDKFRISTYPRTRIDTSLVYNFLYTNTFGELCSKPIGTLSLTASQGLTKLGTDVRLGGTYADPGFITTQRYIGTPTSNKGLVFTPSTIGYVSFGHTPIFIKSNNDDNGSTNYGSAIAFEHKNMVVNPNDSTYNQLLSNSNGIRITSDIGVAEVVSNAGGLLVENGWGGGTSKTTIYASSNPTAPNSQTLELITAGTTKTVRLSAYPSSRNDTGIPVNILSADINGNLRSDNIADLKTALGGSTARQTTFTTIAADGTHVAIDSNNVQGAINQISTYLKAATTETGTFTCSSTGAVPTVTVKYARIGNLVTCYFGFAASSTTSSVGQFIGITSLPFTPTNNFANEFSVTGQGVFQSRNANFSYNGIAIPMIVSAIGGTKNISIEVPNPTIAGANSIFRGNFTYSIN